MVDVEEIEIGNQVEWDYICAEFERIGGRSSQIVVSSLLIQLWDIITRVIGASLRHMQLHVHVYPIIH